MTLLIRRQNLECYLSHYFYVLKIVKEKDMNKDQIEGNWDSLKGKVQKMWGKLTSDDIDVIEGSRKELIGKLKAKYGYATEKAEEEVSRFLSSCGCSSSSKDVRN